MPLFCYILDIFKSYFQQTSYEPFPTEESAALWLPSVLNVETPAQLLLNPCGEAKVLWAWCWAPHLA